MLCLVDFGLLNAAFFALNYWKRGTFNLSSRYERLLIIFYGIWFLVSIFTKKFRTRTFESYWDGISLYVRSGVYAAYCSAFIVVMWGLSAYSRVHVFGTWGLLAIQEGAFFTLYYLVAGRRRTEDRGQRTEDGGQRTEARGRKEKISSFLLVGDFVLVGISFLLVNYLKRGDFYLRHEYEKLFLIIYGLWFGASLVTRKYVRRPYSNYYHALWPWIKTVILMVAVMSVVVFGLRIFYYSRTQVFGTLLVLSIFETLFVGLSFAYKKYRNVDRDVETAEEAKRLLRQHTLSVEEDFDGIRNFLLEPVRHHLKKDVLKHDPDVFALLDGAVNLEKIVNAETAILNSNDTANLGLISGRPLRLFINLRKINDIRWINRYLLSVYENLTTGGYFLGKAHTLTTHKAWIYKRYPKHIANGIYLIDFLVKRVFPKIPFMKQIYFALTKGKGRVISRAEMLGRLCFCGFEIVAEKEIDQRLYFVARKVKTTSLEQNPSYGPLVSFTRIGENNKAIRTHKFRTMHPYSEFLQDYVYETCGLREGGKLDGDFRVTEWGRWMRKLWLDELPMLYNWVRGDLKLFGVRPLSPHYLSLYPEDLRELRKNVKPGLVPPFYADMPKTFEEICESERRYIEAYLKHPVRTQWRYFWKAVWNIVVKGARSA